MRRRYLFCLTALLLMLVWSSSAQARTQLRGFDVAANLKAADFQAAGRDWNANIIRWQLNWKASIANNASPEEYAAWLETALTTLDAALPSCESAGLKVLVDLHMLPGGRNQSQQCRIFTDAAFQSQFLQAWRKIATRYAGNKTVWGYDLGNEPIEGTVASGLLNWNQLAAAAAQTVRSVDTAHVIVVEPAAWALPNGFKNFQPLPSSIQNVVYSVHMYLPHKYTHQGVDNSESLRYPGVIDHVMWDKGQLKRSLQPVVEFQRKYGVRILVGEFGAARWALNASAQVYLNDLIDIFEEYGWDWIYHAFREWDGWSAEHNEDRNRTIPAATRTGREKMLRSYLKKNSKL